MREYADFPFIWSLVVTSLTNHALYMDLEECFSLEEFITSGWYILVVFRSIYVFIQYSVIHSTVMVPRKLVLPYLRAIIRPVHITTYERNCTIVHITSRKRYLPLHKYIKLVKLHPMGKNNVKLQEECILKIYKIYIKYFYIFSIHFYIHFPYNLTLFYLSDVVLPVSCTCAKDEISFSRLYGRLYSLFLML